MNKSEYQGVLVFAEQKNSVIHKVSFELLGKGRQLADDLGEALICVVLGPEDIKTEELIFRGADKVFHVKDEILFNTPDEMVYAKNLKDLINKIKPEVCLFGATSFGRSIAPRIAAALGTGLTADCTALEIDEDGYLVQIRPAFSENILAHIKSDHRPQMATVRYKEFPEAKRDESRTGQVEYVASYNPAERFVEIVREITDGDEDISEARIVVSAGTGLRTADDFKMIEELAHLLGGQVGASRPMVEEGYISKAHQVGYSGNRVKPALYIACGISGAPQHLAGMKDSDMIVAINTDPSAPIFNIADYGIVDDLYEVVPKLIEKIKEQRAG
jgi:electron transfer flavoprotein alpha subunit